MKQVSSLTHALTAAQTASAQSIPAIRPNTPLPTLFRVYTEDLPGLPAIVSRHFDSASILHVTGLYQGQTEAGAIVEIVAPFSSRGRITALALDIAATHNQHSVLVALSNAKTFDSYSVYGRQR